MTISPVRSAHERGWLLSGCLVIAMISASCTTEQTTAEKGPASSESTTPSQKSDPGTLDERKVTVSGEVTLPGALGTQVRMTLGSGRPQGDSYEGYAIARIDEVIDPNNTNTLFVRPKGELCQVTLSTESNVQLKEKGNPNNVSTKLIFDTQRWKAESGSPNDFVSQDSQLEQIDVRCPGLTMTRDCVKVKCGKIEIKLKK